MARRFAGILGLIAFAIVVVRGLLHAAPPQATLQTACLCLFVFAAVGALLGRVAETTVEESVRYQLTAGMPSPSEKDASGKPPQAV